MSTAHPMGDWLNPLNKLVIQKAIKGREEKVVLRSGQTLLFTYNWRNDPNKVWMQSSESFTPCGEFSVNEITSGAWIK